MLQQAGSLEKSPKRAMRKSLNKRMPRMGKVVFAEGGTPVHCSVKDFSDNGAVLSMTGWMGLPSSFVLFVEPDTVRADCRVTKRKGSSISVEFTSVEHGIRLRGSQTAQT